MTMAQSKAQSNSELVCELGNAGWGARCATQVYDINNVTVQG